MARLKVPFQSYPGLPKSDGDLLVRNFQETERFLSPFASLSTDEAPAPAIEIGCWRLGCSGAHHAAGWAELSHRNRWSGGPGSSTTYGFLHNSNGSVILNDSSGVGVRLMLNGSSAHEARVVSSGRVVGSHGTITGGMMVGAWPANSSLAFIGSRHRSAANNAHYLLLGGSEPGATDHNTYFGVSDTNGSFVFRRANNGATVAVIQAPTGRLIVGVANDGVQLGPDPGVGGFAGMRRTGTSGTGNYMLLTDGTGNQTLLNGGLRIDMRLNHAERYRINNAALTHLKWDNTGTIVASFGSGNISLASNRNICLNIPVIAGATVTRTTTGTTQLGTATSRRRDKRDIRPLRGGPGAAQRDAVGIDANPVFKMRPVRFMWRDWDGKGAGLANAREVNDYHPDGSTGLIVEEVAEVAPDAVHWTGDQPDRPWDPEIWGPPPNGETIIPGHPSEPAALDNDALIAYLVDAVQALKEELTRIGGPNVPAPRPN